MELEFDDSEIVLDIPLPNGVEVDEWSLIPLVLPMVMLVCMQILYYFAHAADI